jgi:hypothetical protein
VGNCSGAEPCKKTHVEDERYVTRLSTNDVGRIILIDCKLLPA